ncbi:pinin [Cylas formicarius]|uniref:pinin n=1 Tax=Cylas formicarius TaxID=197179 RepID=UPI002958D667|nr:pinin [Cylas formicarius]
MATEILKSFDALRSELEQAKNSLKGVDENLKRLIGRDPSELPARPDGGVKRPLNDRLSRQGAKIIRRNFENNDPPPRRRNPNAISVFQRLSERPVYEEVQKPAKGLISKVIVTPKEVPSRQKALEAQSKDEKFKERNRRMFGALLGTLQKFQQEENKLKKREEKKAQVEKKIEEHEIKEKEEIRKERQELFYNRRKKQAEIKMLELKMLRMREHTAWEEKQKPRMNFIISKAKPHLHYLPRRMTDKARQLLEVSRSEVEKEIEKKRAAVADELKRIEDRMRRNFEHKFGAKDKEAVVAEQEVDHAEEDTELDCHFDDIVMDSPKNNGDGKSIMATTTVKEENEAVPETVADRQEEVTKERRGEKERKSSTSSDDTDRGVDPNVKNKEDEEEEDEQEPVRVDDVAPVADENGGVAGQDICDQIPSPPGYPNALVGNEENGDTQPAYMGEANDVTYPGAYDAVYPPDVSAPPPSYGEDGHGLPSHTNPDGYDHQEYPGGGTGPVQINYPPSDGYYEGQQNYAPGDDHSNYFYDQR